MKATRHSAPEHTAQDSREAVEGAGMRFRADIEGLRAVAVMLVVLDHLWNKPRGGFVGVDVFFVISGFLITGLLLSEHSRKGRLSIKAFYARRARRILPASLVTLVGTVAAAHFVFNGLRARQTLTDGIWSALFGANIHFAQLGTNYFDTTRPPSPFQHYWSLAVEEQFYLVWPLLLLLVLLAVRSAPRVGAATAAGGIFAVSLAWSIYDTQHNATSAYFSAATRAWELALGALITLAAARLARIPAAARGVMGIVGLVTIVASSFLLDSSTPFPGTAALLPTLGTAAILAAGTSATSRWSVSSAKALSHPVLRYLGRISYSLYLWHWPIIVIIGGAVVADTLVNQVLLLAASVATAACSYHFIEQPVLKSSWLLGRAPSLRRQHSRGRRWFTLDAWRAWRDASVVVAGFAMIFAALLLIQSSPVSTAAGSVATPTNVVIGADPTPTANAPTTPADVLSGQIEAALSVDRYGKLDPGLDDLAHAAAPEWIKDGCLDVNTPLAASKCVYGSASAPKTAVLLGDSVAISWLPGIRAALGPQWQIHVLTRSKCPFVEVAINDPETKKRDAGCAAHTSFALAQVQGLHPDLVVASNSQVYVDRIVGTPAGDGAQQTWAREATGTLNVLAKAASKVVVLAPPPGSGNLQSCVTRVSPASVCNTPIYELWKRFGQSENTAATAAGARYVDPRDWFCVNSECPAVIDSTPVYIDGGHLTAKYSRSLSTLLRSALL